MKLMIMITTLTFIFLTTLTLTQSQPYHLLNRNPKRNPNEHSILSPQPEPQPPQPQPPIYQPPQPQPPIYQPPQPQPPIYQPPQPQPPQPQPPIYQPPQPQPQPPQPQPPTQPPQPPPPPPPKESISVTPPLPTAAATLPPPQCQLSLLSTSFANTYGKPPVTVPYSPPQDCPPPWSLAVLHLSGEISGDQYDRIAAVWLAGAELLRTSTPEPSANGTFWNVRKDVTKYSSLMQMSNVSLSMMLENLVNDVFTGVYHVNLTMLFYKQNYGEMSLIQNRKLGLGFGERGLGEVKEKPADLVIPVGSEEGQNGYWFRIESEGNVGSRIVKIPVNARRIVLELYVSFHGDDEFWYSNPPSSYIKANNISTTRGNGAFREVFVRIDGNVVGSEVPFPVVFTGGINPLFWEPVVAIGAFDLPTYDFELTPYLGLLSDGGSHSFELGVTNAIQFWLVDANLHVWLDERSSNVVASMVVYQPPSVKESWEYEYQQLDGSFEVEAEKKSRSSGWVVSSYGNLTTSVEKKYKFKNSIKFQNYGTYKTVKQEVKVETEVKVVSATGSLISQKTLKSKYPLHLITSTVALLDKKSMMTTNLTHSLDEELKEKSRFGKSTRSLKNSQVSGGWMLVQDHSVLSGVAETQQNLSYRSDSGCFSRSVYVNDSRIVGDNTTTVCPKHFQEVVNALFHVLVYNW